MFDWEVLPEHFSAETLFLFSHDSIVILQVLGLSELSREISYTYISEGLQGNPTVVKLLHHLLF